MSFSFSEIASLLAIAAMFLAAGVWIGKVNSDRKSFREFMSEVRADIKEILSRLAPSVVSGSSPE